jgi:hypothetical protein
MLQLYTMEDVDGLVAALRDAPYNARPALAIPTARFTLRARHPGGRVIPGGAVLDARLDARNDRLDTDFIWFFGRLEINKDVNDQYGFLGSVNGHDAFDYQTRLRFWDSALHNHDPVLVAFWKSPVDRYKERAHLADVIITPYHGLRREKMQRPL